MNQTAIRNFAVRARASLIRAVTQRAFEYGITEDGLNDPALSKADGRVLTSAECEQRRQLISRIRQRGFAQTMEAVAYTWFNRFIALRYMEVNNYLPSHVRVFSDADGAFGPEILREAVRLELTGTDGRSYLDRSRIAELLEVQDNETLYKYLLIAQCNALSDGLPEIFEQISGYTELLFPRHLLREDSVIAHMVLDIPEEDWRDQVQIIGWLYQYYNAEPKDKVFRDLKQKIKISTENIPAATQLFTPDWIVRYLVENSLGRLWIEGHGRPDAADWPYYLEEAEQPESALRELNRLRADRRDIRPEQIRFLDPCMGSGHILVYAFDVLMQIYVSCGYTERDAAQSILQHNLYGLDIDRRASQLACFSLMMKARQYNRRILRPENRPQLANFADVTGVDTSQLTGTLRTFAMQFQDADTYGSLMQLTAPEGFAEELAGSHAASGLRQAQLGMMLRIYRILTQQYDVVCTNPPYMGAGNMNAVLSDFVRKNFPDSKSDLFACFIERCGQLTKPEGFYAMVTQHAWMFLSSYERLRSRLMRHTTVNMAHLGARAFDEIGGEVVQTTAFVSGPSEVPGYTGCYVRLVDVSGEKEKRELFLSGRNRYLAAQSVFSGIPGHPVAYWVSRELTAAFASGISVDTISDFTGSQHITADNDKYLRLHWEVDDHAIGQGGRYAFYAKGGEFRRWYGNLDYVVATDPEAMRFYRSNPTSNCLAPKYWFTEGITYSAVKSKGIGFRYYPPAGAFDKGGATICGVCDLYYVLALLNSLVARSVFDMMNPTINLQVKDVKAMPVIIDPAQKECAETLAKENVSLSRQDWDSFETSHDFRQHPLLP